MAITPSYQNLQISEIARLNIANPNYDGTGDMVSLHQSPDQSRGSLIEQLVIQRVTGTTAMELNLFIDDGSNIRYLHTIDITTEERGQKVVKFDSSSFFLYLKPNEILKGAVTVGLEDINVFVSGGIY